MKAFNVVGQSLIALVFVLAFAPAAPGQNTNQEAPPQKQALLPYLQAMKWDAAERGPLLIVTPSGEMTLERPLPAPNSVSSPSPVTIAAAFGRRIVPARSVTVFAPERMTVINVNPGVPQMSQDYQPSEAALLLLGSLTDAQWAALTGDGLTRAELDREQAELYDIIAPGPVFARLSRHTISANGYHQEALGEFQELDRNHIGLRLNHHLQFRLKMKGQNGFIGEAGRQGATEVWEVKPNYRSGDNDAFKRQFGRQPYARVASRLKPSEVDYRAAALDFPVALSDDLKTVADLLTRIGEPLHLELLADRRVGTLPLYTRFTPGQTARAGDLLEALAWSVTGAFRRLGDRTFLLTDDIQGIYSRYALVSQWYADAGQKRQEQMKKTAERLLKRKAFDRVGFAPGDAWRLSPAQEAALAEDKSKNSHGLGVLLAESEIPADAQKTVQEFREQTKQTYSSPPNFEDKINVVLERAFDLVAPDGKPIRDINLVFPWDSAQRDFDSQLFMINAARAAAAETAKSEPQAPFALPQSVKRRPLLIALKDKSEAEMLTAEAKKRGFTEVWVAQTLKNLDADGLASLNAAIASGKKIKMPVFALASASKDNGIGEEDRTIQGQTGAEWAAALIARAAAPKPEEKWDGLSQAFLYLQADRAQGWIAPTESVVSEIARRMAKVAQTPDLSGLVVRQAFPPGYFISPENVFAGNMPNQMGYALPLRLTFVRREGVDPVDMSATEYAGEELFPFFPSSALAARSTFVGGDVVPDASFVPPSRAWQTFREARGRALMAAIYNAVHAVRPALPLYQSDNMNEADVPLAGPVYASFDAANKVLKLSGVPWSPGYRDSVRMSSRIALNGGEIALKTERNDAEIRERREMFLSGVKEFYTNQTKDWDGGTIDMTMLPASDALRLLSYLAEIKP